MLRASHCSVAAPALALLAWAFALPAAASDAGLLLYRNGQSGATALSALVQGDVRISGAVAACTNCHRRSGLGGAEGSVRPLPVTSPILFRPRTGARPRPGYSEASLKRAVTQGIDAGGRVLDPLMPRYQLTASDQQAIAGYLQSLGSVAAPGVSEDEIVIATVIAADAPLAERVAVERVLHKYVEIKNGGSRQEARRAAAANRHAYGDRHDRSYRRWRLVTWNLTGPASGWDRQLRLQYAAEPAFAVLSGTSGHDWSVVHQFCEREQIPCVLPLTDLPPDAEQDFYSLYYTEGVRLEARIIANHLREQRHPAATRVLVVRPDEARGAAAYDAFDSAWLKHGGQKPRQLILAPGRSSAAAFWKSTLEKERPDVVIAWVASDQLAGLAAAMEGGTHAGTLIYTSESFTDWAAAGETATRLAHAWHVSPYRLAQGQQSRFPREQVWLSSQGLGDLDIKIAGRVLFACHVLGEELAGIENNFSRDYFMEGLEHMLDNTNMTTMYPRTALGQGQRYLSRGAYVLSPSAAITGSSAGASWVGM
jgi:hypothetical protein